MKRKLVLVTGVLALALAAVSAQTLPAGVQKGPAMGGITQYDFPNGLKVLLYPDAAEPKITITHLSVARGTKGGRDRMAPRLHT